MLPLSRVGGGGRGLQPTHFNFLTMPNTSAWCSDWPGVVRCVSGEGLNLSIQSLCKSSCVINLSAETRHFMTKCCSNLQYKTACISWWIHALFTPFPEFFSNYQTSAHLELT